ncbi:MAG TPA: biliverdin-producing heme oxygenase [Kofleriaceae bacterium]
MLRGPVAKSLRDATAELHREAERHVRILDPDATEATYTRYLEKMFGFHAACEHAFSIPFADRIKSRLIADDLVELGGVAEPLAVIPQMRSRSYELGCAYVLEGSTLGGAFILAKMPSQRATRFLRGYGERTGEMWRSFCAELETAEDPQETVAGARDTFTALIAWLDEPAREPPHPFKGLALER